MGRISFYNYTQKEKEGATNSEWDFQEHFMEEKMLNVTLKENTRFRGREFQAKERASSKGQDY